MSNSGCKIVYMPYLISKKVKTMVCPENSDLKKYASCRYVSTKFACFEPDSDWEERMKQYDESPEAQAVAEILYRKTAKAIAAGETTFEEIEDECEVTFTSDIRQKIEEYIKEI